MQHCQPLEQRRLLTTMIQTTPFVPDDGHLVIEGTRRDDRIWLSVEAGTLYVLGPTGAYLKQGTGRQATLLPAQGHTIDLATLKSIRINSGDGHDEIILGSLKVPVTVYGGRGNDTLSGGRGDDVLLGQSGHDRLWGGDGDDLLDGGLYNDRIEGGRGDDTLQGAQGDDRLYGGGGYNQVSGGPDADAQISPVDLKTLDPLDRGNDLVDNSVERHSAGWKEIPLNLSFDGMAVRRTPDGRLEAEVGFTFGTSATLMEFIAEPYGTSGREFVIRARAWTTTGGGTADMYSPRRRLDLGKVADGVYTFIAAADREELARIRVNVDQNLRTITQPADHARFNRSFFYDAEPRRGFFPGGLGRTPVASRT